MSQSQVAPLIRYARATVRELHVAERARDAAIAQLERAFQPEIDKALRALRDSGAGVYSVDRWEISISSHDARVRVTVTVLESRVRESGHRMSQREVWDDPDVETALTNGVAAYLREKLDWAKGCRFAVVYPEDFSSVD